MLMLSLFDNAKVWTCKLREQLLHMFVIIGAIGLVLCREYQISKITIAAICISAAS